MADNPLVSISRFPGMGDKGLYYVENFSSELINGKSFLRQMYGQTKKMNEDTTGFTNYPLVKCMIAKSEDVTWGSFYGLGDGYLVRQNALSPGDDSNGSVLFSFTPSESATNPSIMETDTGNMLFTKSQYLNMCVHGQNTGDGNTNDLVDTLGRDLTSWVVVGDTIYNLVKQKTAVVTSISTTTSTNDTLNFTAGWSGGGDIDDGEDWMVIKEDWEALVGGAVTTAEGSTIVNFDGDYFVGNNTHVAKLSNDETTFDEDFTELPAAFTFKDMAVNANKILIGCNKHGRGKLLVWNGVDQNTYQSIIDIPMNVTSVKSYGAAWLVLAGSTLYLTNGYTIKQLSKFPGSNGFTDYQIRPYGMMVLADKVYFSAQIDLIDKQKAGVYIYDISKNSWTYSPCVDTNGEENLYNVNSGCFFFEANGDSVFTTYEDAGNKNTLSKIGDESAKNSAMITYVDLGSKRTINHVDLFVTENLLATASTSLTATITIGIADGSYNMWRYFQANATSSAYNEIEVAGGSTKYASVGELVRVLEGTAAGEYAFITAIENQGTATEKWTLDRNLSGYVANASFIQVMPFHKMSETTLASREIDNPLHFPLGRTIKGDMYLIVLIRNGGDSSLEIRHINVF